MTMIAFNMIIELRNVNGAIMLTLQFLQCIGVTLYFGKKINTISSCLVDFCQRLNNDNENE